MALLVLCGMTVCTAAIEPEHRLVLQTTRHAPSDLEVGGSLQGVPQGETRFVSYQSSALSHRKRPIPSPTIQTSEGPCRSVVSPCRNYPSGSARKMEQTMVIAICDDKYAAHYPASYVRDHHPLLVLKVNGLEPDHWPLGTDRMPMGPYMVSPSQLQTLLPCSVGMMMKRRSPGASYASIYVANKLSTPRSSRKGAAAADPIVQQGYTIARQNCFRCHSRSGEGGQKSKLLWRDLAQEAVKNPTRFDAYVRHPKNINPQSQMAASPQYDDPVLSALRRYFASFQEASR